MIGFQKRCDFSVFYLDREDTKVTMERLKQNLANVSLTNYQILNYSEILYRAQYTVFKNIFESAGSVVLM